MAELNRLKTPQPTTGRRMSDRLEAIRYMKERVGEEVPVMGWVEGALAEAADLRGVNNVLMDLYLNPDWLKELLERCVEVGVAFAQAQVDAGADIIGLGDAVASLISPDMYREFALPYEQRIFAAVHEKKALARLHICGNTNRILADLAETGADIIDLDWMVDLGQAAAAFGAGPVVCGNFDPVAVMQQGTPAQVRQATIECLRLGGPRSISAAGCEIPLGTPVENLLAQAQALRDYGAGAALR
jgi:MtaA/CmuA family methyltransferase